MKHTEGPLRVSGSIMTTPQGTVNHLIRHGDSDEISPLIAEILSDGGRLPAQANAHRLVACWNACIGINPEAVPDLLDACQLAAEEIFHLVCALNGNPNTMGCYTRVTQAIAKAVD